MSRSAYQVSLHYALVSLYLMLITTFIVLLALTNQRPSEYKDVEEKLEKVQHGFVHPLASVSGGVAYFINIGSHKLHLGQSQVEQIVAANFPRNKLKPMVHSTSMQSMNLQLAEAYDEKIGELTPEFKKFVAELSLLLNQHKELRCEIILHLPDGSEFLPGIPVHQAVRAAFMQTKVPADNLRIGVNHLPVRINDERTLPQMEVIAGWIG